MTAERLLSSTFGLMSNFCLDKLDWESFHSESAQEDITRSAEPFLHFNEKQKGITELSSLSSHPIASNRLQQAAHSSVPQGDIQG